MNPRKVTVKFNVDAKCVTVENEGLIVDMGNYAEAPDVVVSRYETPDEVKAWLRTCPSTVELGTKRVTGKPTVKQNDKINRAGEVENQSGEAATPPAPVEFLVSSSSEAFLRTRAEYVSPENLPQPIDDLKSRPLQMKHRCNQELLASATDTYTATVLASVNWAKSVALSHFDIRMTKWQVVLISYYAFGSPIPALRNEKAWCEAISAFLKRFGHPDCEE